MKKILQIQNLSVRFPYASDFWWRPKRTLYALDHFTLDVFEGEVLGIVGESGCGKSSLAKALVGLNPISTGDIVFDGHLSLAQANPRQWREVRGQIQFIFQDPIAALNPRMTVYEIIAEPLRVAQPHLSQADVQNQVIAMVVAVGLQVDHLNRYPQAFSGGQCQRIGIARALVVRPRVLICDESVSGLDVSVKAQIVNLLKSLQRSFQLTIVFISHDLSILRHLCDRVVVMYLGRMMEVGSVDAIYQNPLHPYTQALFSAIPRVPDGSDWFGLDGANESGRPWTRHAQTSIADKVNFRALAGELPSAIDPPSGCVFHTRCPKADDLCATTEPDLKQHDGQQEGQMSRCWKAISTT